MIRRSKILLGLSPARNFGVFVVEGCGPGALTPPLFFLKNQDGFTWIVPAAGVCSRQHDGAQRERWLRPAEQLFPSSLRRSVLALYRPQAGTRTRIGGPACLTPATNKIGQKYGKMNCWSLISTSRDFEYSLNYNFSPKNKDIWLHH